jgi:hypothetical protein
MFITSPEMVALKMAAELALENAEGNIIGMPTISGVTFSAPLNSLLSELRVQGNNQKPHPLNMVIGGLPSNVGERRRLMADYYDETIDADTLRNGLRELRLANRETELAAFGLVGSGSGSLAVPSATP